MAAVAVPPSGWGPIGARELLTVAHRNFGRGLALSALGHAALLACVLWLQASSGDSKIRLFKEPIRIIRDPTVALPPPLVPREVTTGTRGHVPPSENGRLTPVDREFDFTPKIPVRSGDFPVSRDVPGSENEGISKSANIEAVVESLPRENDVVRRDTEPIPVFDPKPEYPEWAKEARITGRVLLKILVDRDGSVARVRVLQSVVGLDGAARDGLLRWKFKPARLQGKPVAVWVEIPVIFRLEP